MADALTDLLADPELEVMSVVTCDFNGFARGKFVTPARLEGSAPMRLSNILTMMDYSGMPYSPPEGDDRWWPSWAEGYTDTRAVVDPNTARQVPWQLNTGLVVADLERADGQGLLEFLPRTTLKRLIARLADHGLTAKVAQELEFMTFQETQASAVAKGFRDLVPLWSLPAAYSLTAAGRNEPVLRTLRDHLEGFGLPIDTWDVEGGPGQIEMNLPPEDALTASDQAFLFKHAIKEITSSIGLYASFVPKLATLGFGNGNHLNLSLWEGQKNAFFDPDNPDKLSDICRHFVGGIVNTLREMTLCYAPTPLSYRRFIPYFSTGMQACWGIDNKSVGVRVVTESENLARIEQRTAGADANPYILTAACLAAGLYGIENQVEPPPAVQADAYADPKVPMVPTNINEALDLFEASQVANDYLGEDFVRFYAHGRRIEAAAFAEAAAGTEGAEVTDWELHRYFDIS